MLIVYMSWTANLGHTMTWKTNSPPEYTNAGLEYYTRKHKDWWLVTEERWIESYLNVVRGHILQKKYLMPQILETQTRSCPKLLITLLQSPEMFSWLWDERHNRTRERRKPTDETRSQISASLSFCQCSCSILTLGAEDWCIVGWRLEPSWSWDNLGIFSISLGWHGDTHHFASVVYMLQLSQRLLDGPGCTVPGSHSDARVHQPRALVCDVQGSSIFMARSGRSHPTRQP